MTCDELCRMVIGKLWRRIKLTLSRVLKRITIIASLSLDYILDNIPKVNVLWNLWNFQSQLIMNLSEDLFENADNISCGSISNIG